MVIVKTPINFVIGLPDLCVNHTAYGTISNESKWLRKYILSTVTIVSYRLITVFNLGM